MFADPLFSQKEGGRSLKAKKKKDVGLPFMVHSFQSENKLLF